MTSSVSLRRAVREDDLEFLSALANDPAVAPFLAPGRGELQVLHELKAAEPPSGLYLIEARGERVGGLALTVVGRFGHICEITRVMLRSDARGSGIATQAVRLACQIVLIEHELHRIETQVYGDNLSGQRLFERARFTREGTRRSAYWRRERWLDGIYYGLLADEL